MSPSQHLYKRSSAWLKVYNLIICEEHHSKDFGCWKIHIGNKTNPILGTGKCIHTVKKNSKTQERGFDESVRKRSWQAREQTTACEGPLFLVKSQCCGGGGGAAQPKSVRKPRPLGTCRYVSVRALRDQPSDVCAPQLVLLKRCLLDTLVHSLCILMQDEGLTASVKSAGGGTRRTREIDKCSVSSWLLVSSLLTSHSH